MSCLIKHGEALHPKFAEQLMVPKLPVVGGPADCNLVIDGLQREGEPWQVVTEEPPRDGWRQYRCHRYKIAELDGIRSLLYMGPGERAPY